LYGAQIPLDRLYGLNQLLLHLHGLEHVPGRNTHCARDAEATNLHDHAERLPLLLALVKGVGEVNSTDSANLALHSLVLDGLVDQDWGHAKFLHLIKRYCFRVIYTTEKKEEVTLIVDLLVLIYVQGNY